MKITMPYGETAMEALLPEGIPVQLVDIPPAAVSQSESDMLAQAMEHPIGTETLKRMVSPKDSVVIVVNDQTRPGPNARIMEAIAAQLDAAGVPDENVTVLFATGSHRAPTPAEMETIVGKSVYQRYRMVAHRCTDDASLAYLGDTPEGMPLYINRYAAQCTFLITTGLITQHHCAGYSGGRKSIVPGIAGFQTLHYHHSFPVYQYEPAMDFMHGNPFHEIALEAAKKAGVRFIVNAVQDTHKNVVGFVAGDLEQAHEAGIALCRQVSVTEVERRADVIIASPGGAPRDIDLYQSQKALSVAELICREPCVFILVAACSDGFGEGSFREIMETYADPDEIIGAYAREGFTVGSNKAFNYARALKKGRIIVVTQSLSRESVERAHLEWAATLQDAVNMAIEPGTAPTVTVIPHASGIYVRVKDE